MKDSFVNMMKILKHGGQIDVVARIDGKDYLWECDGLQHAVLLPEAGRNHAEAELAEWKDSAKAWQKAFEEAKVNFIGQIAAGIKGFL
jgi:isopenicillin N synthase-like dioxygenase